LELDPDSNSRLFLSSVQMANVSVADEIAAAKKEKTQLEHDLARASDALERVAIRNQLAAVTNLLASYQAAVAQEAQAAAAQLQATQAAHAAGNCMKYFHADTMDGVFTKQVMMPLLLPLLPPPPLMPLLLLLLLPLLLLPLPLPLLPLLLLLLLLLSLLLQIVLYVADITSSGTPLEAKTVSMVIPPVLHGNDIKRFRFTFHGEESFAKYLRNEQCGGLILVNEEEIEPLAVDRFAQLVSGATYTTSLPYYKEALSSVLGEARHLQQSREDEFGKALTLYAQRAEPDQGYELREDLRMQLTSDKKIAEHDVVVLGKDKAYVGSHKTHAKGAKPVKEIAQRCKELAKLPNKLPAIVMPAFMVERPEPEAELRIQKACKDLKVVRFHRSGHAIKVMNSMGAVGRLQRF
ncbi:hypothetical protein QJQ45_023326, partial [Haematococcus lacustris]